MALLSGLSPDARTVAVQTAAYLRADAGLYLFIVLYTMSGLLFLEAAGAEDSAAYEVYVGRWLMLFGFLLPAITALANYGVVVHRFSRRRNLALRRLFSGQRLARFISGMALVQAMVLFQGTFTSVKNTFSTWQGGFAYDGIQADLDKALHFGADPWRWLHPIADNDWARMLIEWNYDVLWFVICFGMLGLIATSRATEGIRQRYLFTFMVVWIVVGNVLAGAFTSAGPAFYGLVTGDHGRFAEQLAFLAQDASSAYSAAAYQQYLWDLHVSGQVGFGSGISAFPSVHVGLIMMNALFLAERSWRWGAAAFVYVGIVLASSVYLAWHYAIDGYVAIIVVVAIYFATRALFAARRKVEPPFALVAAPAVG